eukprot:CAMPEP_0180588618 /NCGR_PEP_ID=MMETSP1037_2-20121125/17727_1 /TAXON_ID=632150 /ORGANISM="Azadinium spinosum, Strain 3D9" /LENGTH=872 /DNA_ID=CAMNT_0022606771 /DNA_START=9 /DNA_END=2627 /DNA_ORIENTATION=+
MAGDASPRVCDGGLLLPIGGEAEQRSAETTRAVIYAVALLYCFLGVSIVADLFMNSIEQITSGKKRVKVKGTSRFVTKSVWNQTVANLTLMALGSSAPEILLSVVETGKNGFHSGDLGPSTIVGSAAFNLHVIIAACIVAIPLGESRKIKEFGVFVVTAVFSIVAYLWLVFIVQVRSPDVIEIWEGGVTLGLFPILVFSAYRADVSGWLNPVAAAQDAAVVEDLPPVGMLPGPAALAGRASALPIPCRPDASDASPTLLGRSRPPTPDHGPPRPIQRSVSKSSLSSGASSPKPLVGGRKVRQFSPCRIARRGSKESMTDGDTRQNRSPQGGVIMFDKDSMEVRVGKTQREKEESVWVFRRNGSTGNVSCRYETERLSAVPGYDYVEAQGTLSFEPGDTRCKLSFTVLPKTPGKTQDSFQIRLKDVEGGAIFNPDDDGGDESALLTVTIQNEWERPGEERVWPVLLGLLDRAVNLDDLRLGAKTWCTQILDELCCGRSSNEEEIADEKAEPCCNVEWILSAAAWPWKVFYAIGVPPPGFGGGWPCFCLALVQIGFLTAVIGDVAELFGCVAGLEDSITAITFVALGTSLPDLFASRTAAAQDEWADASIVNVTGSNSVNVFLGIGMPWLAAATYWRANGPDGDWFSRYGDLAATYPDGAFVVRAGDLGFSVAVFIVTALAAIALLRFRRMSCGGELGGAPGTRAVSAFFLVLLWVFYIGLSIWQVTTKSDSLQEQLTATLYATAALAAATLGIGVPISLIASTCGGAKGDGASDDEEEPIVVHSVAKPCKQEPHAECAHQEDISALLAEGVARGGVAGSAALIKAVRQLRRDQDVIGEKITAWTQALINLERSSSQLSLTGAIGEAGQPCGSV